MLTIPRSYWVKKALKVFISKFDIHRWIIAEETGANGYQHFQVRVYTSASQDQIMKFWGIAHVERSSGDMRYERKEGRFWCSDDTDRIRSCRFGIPTRKQRDMLDFIRAGGDRSISIIYDAEGGVGKTWLVRHLWERGEAFYVPPTTSTVQGIIQFICAGYRGERYILIDIPRSWKWSDQIYTAIETVQDGFVYDTRYSASLRDIWGVKVAVMCNTKPNPKGLSADRWRLYDCADKIGAWKENARLLS